MLRSVPPPPPRPSQITLHPQYQWPVIYHDLALIELGRPVAFSATVRPYCLAAPGQDLPGTEAHVAGIGATEFGRRRVVAGAGGRALSGT